MSGFMATDRRARDLCRDCHERSALMMVEAESEKWTPWDEWNSKSGREWSEPFECRDTDLMEWGGWASKRGARAWLQRFVRAGYLMVESQGNNRTARLIRLRNPYHVVNHVADHVVDRNSSEQKPVNGESGPQLGPQPGPQPVKTRDQETRDKREEGRGGRDRRVVSEAKRRGVPKRELLWRAVRGGFDRYPERRFDDRPEWHRAIHVGLQRWDPRWQHRLRSHNPQFLWQLKDEIVDHIIDVWSEQHVERPVMTSVREAGLL